jgi:hypothetical protein
MSTDIRHFGAENSDGTVHSGKRLVELSHGTAYGRPFLCQQNIESIISKIQGGLNACDTSSDDERPFGKGKHFLLKRPESANSVNCHFDQLESFGGGGIRLMHMHPTALFPQVRHF